MLAILDALIGGAGNAVGWVLISILGSGVWIVRQTIRNKRAINDLNAETKINSNPTRLESHEERMERQQEDIAELKQYFTGDEDDPNNPGLLSEIHDIKESLDENNE